MGWCQNTSFLHSDVLELKAWKLACSTDKICKSLNSVKMCASFKSISLSVIDVWHCVMISQIFKFLSKQRRDSYHFISVFFHYGQVSGISCNKSILYDLSLILFNSMTASFILHLTQRLRTQSLNRNYNQEHTLMHINTAGIKSM